MCGRPDVYFSGILPLGELNEINFQNHGYRIFKIPLALIIMRNVKKISLTIRNALVSLSLSISMQNCKRLVVFDSTAVQCEICSLNTRPLCSRSLRICSSRDAFFASSEAIKESIWEVISASNKLVFACRRAGASQKVLITSPESQSEEHK